MCSFQCLVVLDKKMWEWDHMHIVSPEETLRFPSFEHEHRDTRLVSNNPELTHTKRTLQERVVTYDI